MRRWDDLFTGRDNRTYDLTRVLMAGFSLAYIVLSIWLIAKGREINLLEWAGGAGVIMAGGSAGVAMKRAAEPDP